MQSIHQKAKLKQPKKAGIVSTVKSNLLPLKLNRKLQLNTQQLNELIGLLNAGELDDCVSLATHLTDTYPRNGLVWKILGTAYQKQNLNDLSVKALEKAADILPKDFEVAYNLGNALFDLQKLDEAIDYYQKSIEIAPHFFESYFNLGQVYEKKCKFKMAEYIYEQVLKISPNQINAYFSLADLYKKKHKNLEYIKPFKKILKIYLSSSEAALALAIAFQKVERLDESDLSFYHATSLKSDNIIGLHITYSEFLMKLGKLEKAIHLLDEVIAIEADNFDANSVLGLIYLEKKDFEKAEFYFKKAIDLSKDSPVAFNHYGLYLYHKGVLGEAEKYLNKSLKIAPENISAMNNLGLVYEALLQHEKAVSLFNQALRIKPDYMPSIGNIALSLNRLGKQSEAIEYVNRGLELEPMNKGLLINAAVIHQGMGEVKKAIDANLKVIELDSQNLLAYNNLFYSLCLTQSYPIDFFSEKLQQFGAILSSMASFQYDTWLNKKHSKRYRVGFVSADFFDHPVGSFLLSIIQNINKNDFELIAYTNNPAEDAVTLELKKNFHEWISIIGLSDIDTAKLIHDDGVDLLIDLSGHTSGNRLSMFAYKPAPVQMTWLGYWDSTGVQQIDYILLDELSAPQKIQAQFTETVKYIPDTRLCYSPPRLAIPVNELPANQNVFITFGAYHNFAKVSDDVIELWASILRALPTSRLRWQTKSFHDVNLIKKIHQKFSDLGVSHDRIDLIGFMMRKAYLESYHSIDFILDCFPFSACTTTCDGLWMGVPTLTMPGVRLGGRQGVSLMSAVGLPNWVAKDKQQFISKAIEHANDLETLSKIRQGLRQQLLSSPLADAQKYAKNLEVVLKDILNNHQILKNIDQTSTQDQAYKSTTEKLENAIRDVYEMALQQHDVGNFEEAAIAYLEILKVSSKHPEVNHNLGVIETHIKGVEYALPRFEVAIAEKPEIEQYWVSYFDALVMAGRIEKAAEMITNGLQYSLKPETAKLLLKDIELELSKKKTGFNSFTRLPKRH
jgi:protein O-GlcNAc transferase